jgi:hypothetical protein
MRSLLLPLNVSALITAHLKQVGIDPDALLFPYKPGTNIHWGASQINPLWKRIRALAGYTGRFQALRTCAARAFAKLNLTSKELTNRFGHRGIEAAMKYQCTTGRDAELLRRLG